MSRNSWRLLARCASSAAVLVLVAASPAFGQGYQLAWSDEFDSTAVDAADWSFDIGTGCPSLCGWGNNELQYYRSQNATMSGGLLTITAKEESWGGRDYTSARMVTRNKVDFTYGRVEMRARLPIGQGLWPAFWLLFTDNTYGGWAASGEIDIMEYVGQTPNKVFGTIHFGGPSPANAFRGLDYYLSPGTFHDDFHEFALEWEPGELRWYVDGTLYASQNDWYSTGGQYPAPFDHDFHILLNCAVGGNLPGPPDGTTSFPQEYVIDYVRVYQKPEFEDCRVVFAGMEWYDIYNNGWFIFNGNGSGGMGSVTAPAPVGGNVRSLGTGWSGAGPYLGGFGKSNYRDLTGMTHFSFWIRPDPGQDYQLQIQLQDDDDGDDAATPGPDDEFQYNIDVKPSGGDVVAGGGWQRVSIPLADFFDDNSYLNGGNGIFDPISTANGGNGRLINIAITLINVGGSSANFLTDRWEFTREDGAVDGFVWTDTDGDGVREGGEAGLSGVSVQLRDLEQLQIVDATTTSGSGFYSFPALPAGEYRIEVDSADLPTGSTATGDPDGVSTLHEAWVAVDCSGTLAGQDFGYQPNQIGVPGPGVPGPTLFAGHPNPFSSSTRIAFTLERPGPATVSIYDLAGRRVRDLLRAELPAGTRDVVWDGLDDAGRSAASGFYLVVLSTNDGTRTRRVLRLR